MTKLDLEGLWNAGFNSYASNRPIANISFALNYYLHRYDVTVYHLTNIIIHILAGIFLYLFIKDTLQISNRQSLNSSIIAFFAALVWLVHPIQTQSVTYVVQRMNSMAAMFYLLSMLLYVKGRLADGKRGCLMWFAGCVLSGLLAIGSKEIAATLPFFILLYEWYFFQDLSKVWFRRNIAYIVGTIVILGVIAFLYLGMNPFQVVLSGYKNRDFTLFERTLTEFRVVMHYISLLVYPHPSRLNLDYAFPLSHSLVQPITTLFSFVVVLGLIVVSIYIARKERLLSFCILWFLGNLVIESSIIGLEIVYEHRTYLPSMCFFLLAGVLVFKYVKKRSMSISLLCVVTALFCLWTYERNNVWRDPVTLWTDCAGKSWNKARPHSNLALALYEQNRHDEAIVHASQAIRIDSDYRQAHNNLGVALTAKGLTDDAISHYAEALRIEPSYAEAHYNWGVALEKQGNSEKAIAHFLDALRIRPNHYGAHYNLGTLLARQGKLTEAITHFLKTLQIRPKHIGANYNLGLVLQKQGRLDKAIDQFLKLLKIKPDQLKALNNLGLCLAKQGRLDEAELHYLEALRIKPDYARVHMNLGLILAQQDRLDEAIDHFSRALEIKPDYAVARRSLRSVLRRAGSLSGRADRFETPLEMRKKR
ncbi:MAG: tetratricopeptide repeat protein [Deltaproteobacteria bacterium]|nr:tetratricopeptide repeat protein [Deltaproteobacteria bacterium]